MKNKKQAFSLVELIVVITLLSILGVIAFISYGSYNGNARDSKRLSDIGMIKKALEVYALKNNKYPEPSDGNIITYSGSEVRTQGVFGESVLREIKNLSKPPKDISLDKFYTYSVLNTKKEYELATILESDLVGINFNKVNADFKKSKAYVTGNYNGSVAKALSGSTTYVLAVPSIINSDITLSDIIDIYESNKIVIDGKANLPFSYSGANLEMNGEEGLTIINAEEALVYTGSIFDIDTPEEKRVFLSNLQEAYENTIIEDSPIIEQLLSIDVSEDSVFVSNYVGHTINNNFGGNLPIEKEVEENNSSYVCEDMTQENVDNLNNYFAGVLSPLSKIEWCSLPTFSLPGINSSTIPSDIGYLTNLNALVITSSPNLISIPPEIGNLTNLEVFVLNLNPKLTSIPPEIGNLNNLNTLILNDNDLTSLPSEIGDLSNLTNLNLNNNSLSFLPIEIEQLNNLENLNLGQNVALGNLNANFDKDSSIVEGIGIGLGGEDIIIGGNGTKVLFNDSLTCGLSNLDVSILDSYFGPAGIGPYNKYEWCAQTVINFSNQDLGNLPIQIGKLSNLSVLDITSNSSLTSLPSEIGNLSNLQTLVLNANPNLTSLPSEIGNLSNLNTLVLAANASFSFLPSEIGNLNSLNTLVLPVNALTSLPPEIGDLNNLLVLDLSLNNLQSLPIEISNLFNLETLNLVGNIGLGDLATNFDKDSSIVEGIGEGSLGEDIIVGGNGTKVLFNDSLTCGLNNVDVSVLNTYFTGVIGPYNKYEWCEQTDLNAANSGLGNLPTQIGKLVNLKWIYLGGNNISEISSEIGNLTNLILLQLQHNSIISIPDEIRGLVNLEHLNFNTNFLSKLPNGMKDLEKLIYLDLNNNTSLGNLNTTFFNGGPDDKTQVGVGTLGETVTIGDSGGNVFMIFE